MKLLRRIAEFHEWLPLAALPVVVIALTDWFSKALSLETWLFLGVVTALNVGWLVLFRSNRKMLDTLEKYPGFRMNKNG